MITSNNQNDELINSDDSTSQFIKKVAIQLLDGFHSHLRNTSQNDDNHVNLIIPLDLNNFGKSIFKDISGGSLKLKFGQKENSNYIEVTITRGTED